MTCDVRVDVVARGYDAMATEFLAWAQRIEGDPRLEWLEELCRRLPQGATVLELGCGAGAACARVAEAGFAVTGVDVSLAQLELARTRAPGATFLHADFLDLELPHESFDAVCSFYVLNHVPRDRLADLIDRIAAWLKPGGLFMHAFGTSDNGGWTGDWLGVEMFFSSFEPDTNRCLVTRSGLEVLRDEVVTFTEPHPEPGKVSFHWILARR